MKPKDILARLTGISLPVFGVSWNPSPTSTSIAKRVIAYLEDRRVLYTPCEAEVPQHCVTSVIEIRHFLTDVIVGLGSEPELDASLRAMRGACRAFLDRVGQDDRRIITFGAHPGHYASWEFNDALGQMRGVFGVHVALIATRFNVGVEDGLAKILPPRPE